MLFYCLFMFMMLILKSISILLGVASVASSEVNSENYNNVKRLVRSIHDYNHPPSVFSVPVAIVYEDGNKQEKSLKFVDTQKPKDQDNDDVTTMEVTTQAEIITEATTPTKITTSKYLKAQFKVSDEINTKSHPDDGYIIPVAVIYDEVPKNVPTTPKVTVDKTKSRQQRRRKVIKKAKQQDESQPNSEEIQKQLDREVKQESTDTTKFPKRTEGRDPIVPIVQSESYVFANSGDFHYSYEGGDGTKAFMRGELRSLDDEHAGAAVEGSFSYTGKDGNDYSLTYTADENGYRPIGAHLPTPPPIPPAIARALKYLATKTTPEPVTDSL